MLESRKREQFTVNRHARVAVFSAGRFHLAGFPAIVVSFSREFPRMGAAAIFLTLIAKKWLPRPQFIVREGLCEAVGLDF
jgi:hypothetical protein